MEIISPKLEIKSPNIEFFIIILIAKYLKFRRFYFALFKHIHKFMQNKTRNFKYFAILAYFLIEFLFIFYKMTY